MLNFCDAPYQFFPPRPSKPVMAASRHLNRFLLRFDRKIHCQEINGHFEEVKQLVDKGDSILFTPNHPTRTDPQLVGEIASRLGTHTSFMAAYDVFLENKIQAWFMQKNGCFSVDREGNDRKALSTAIDILKQQRGALTIFPEGNTYQLNDRITPILDGPAFVAARAQRSMGSAGNVWVVPVSLKYTYIHDVRKQIESTLAQIARVSEYPKSASIHNVFDIGGHLISSWLKDKMNLNHRVEFDPKVPEQVRYELKKLTDQLAGTLEEELGMNCGTDFTIFDRVRKVRSKIHQLRSADNRHCQSVREKYRQLADRAIFTFRLIPYMIPSLTENPTLDRYAETVARMKEDLYSKSFAPFGVRKAIAHIGAPVCVADSLAEAGGKVKDTVAGLTSHLEGAIQHGIDKINASNTEIGGELVLRT